MGVGCFGEFTGREIPRVPAGDVGGDAADLLGGAGFLVGVGEFLGAGLWGNMLDGGGYGEWRGGMLGGGVLTEVVVPAKPATVTSIDVHGDVGEVELLKSIGDALAVARGGVLAGLLVGVGDEVGKRVGFDDEGDGGVGIFLEDGDDGYALLGIFPTLMSLYRHLRSMYSLL